MNATASQAGTSEVVTGERTLEIRREYDAPVERVWAAWADAGQQAAWWGPAGFRTETQARDFRSGGQWRFVMIGPDGHEYQNLVSYIEVREPSLLRYRHGGTVEVEPVSFEVEVRFEELGPARTRLVMRSLFPSANALRHVVEHYGAIEGGKQCQARLAGHLAAHASTSGAAGGSPAAARPFVLTRHFAAPRERVWNAWTQVDALAQWMGPAGCTTLKADLDLRPGGRYHYGLRMPNGVEMWGLWEFREIVKPSRLAWVQGFSDAAGGLARHPMAPTWPLRTLSVVMLHEHAGIGRGTTLELQWSPIDATPEEQAMFDGAHESMRGGWGGTLQKLEEWLARGG